MSTATKISHLKAISSFRTDDPVFIFATFLDNGGSRDSEFPYLDPSAGLVFGGVLQVEKIRGPANVVFIEMSERHDIVRLLQIRSESHRQVNSNIVFVSAGVCCVIEENLLASFRVDSATIGVPRAEKTSPCAYGKTYPLKS